MVNVLADKRDASAVMLMEIIGTMMLVIVVLVSSRSSNNPSPSWINPRVKAALLIGSTVSWIHFLLFVVVHSCGINPARSFGTAVIAGVWEGHWVFLIGPLIGGVLAGLVSRFVLVEEEEDDKTREGHNQDNDVKMSVLP